MGVGVEAGTLALLIENLGFTLATGLFARNFTTCQVLCKVMGRPGCFQAPSSY